MRSFFHPEQLLHHPRSYYSRGQMRTPQEVPERARRLVQAAHSLGFEVRQPEDAGLQPLLAVHGAPYLAFLEEAHRRWKDIPEDWGDEVMSNIFVREPNALRGILAQAARYLADGSCPVGEQTWRSAYWSAQSAIAGARALLDGEPAAYALCRPPGHHARAEAAGGFCYLNNAAIAAQVLRERFARVAVLDTDMHHGQGIQEIFYERADVLYVSVHGDPTNFYPGVAGFTEERGSGAGEGYNLNLPMAHGASEADFLARLEQALAAVKAFGAEVLVLSLGFDIYELDPQSKVAVTRDGFAILGQRIRSLGLPCLIVQEGGYHLDSLEGNARAFFADSAAWAL
ncbi:MULTISPECIES: histone deacetylase family protein [Pseudomonas]|uniref:histone deacetylase family protein n=1 Tax=Pseudomonas TaxID=286 RepID=UPI000F486D4F|nr:MULTISPECIES: histone deacetylase family protein [Pseudomonas]MDD1023172.1 histone deacetylase family protein [Pseudomonas idahonensis]ROL90952.1 acetylpolyamine amidohydrolase [Pseudomonas protegens]ROM00657.1 acetylpolyamine amidohydrolase [Pseudomonas protegens]ROM07183.1 acetylpolyamine amidohydrolase [Pseudomonas protegens]ROM08276.1 acetylpolyamine amidohydrolase [Pseudomonas protegens]